MGDGSEMGGGDGRGTLGKRGLMKAVNHGSSLHPPPEFAFAELLSYVPPALKCDVSDSDVRRQTEQNRKVTVTSTFVKVEIVVHRTLACSLF